MELHEEIILNTFNNLYEVLDKSRINESEYLIEFLDNNIDYKLYEEINKKVNNIQNNINIIEYYNYDIYEAIQLYKEKNNCNGEELLIISKDKFYYKLAYNIILDKIKQKDYIDEISGLIYEMCLNEEDLLLEIEEYENENNIIDYHKG